MKITVNVDCTPDEARAFMGLPDMKPIQMAVMTELERRVLEEVDRLSPDVFMKSWMSLLPYGSEQMQEAVAGFMKRSPGTSKPGNG